MSTSPVEVKPGQSIKVFKQARLPFKVLDIKTAFQINAQKKRKLSESETTLESKLPKTEKNSENDANSVNTDFRESESCLKIVETIDINEIDTSKELDASSFICSDAKSDEDELSEQSACVKSNTALNSKCNKVAKIDSYMIKDSVTGNKTDNITTDKTSNSNHIPNVNDNISVVEKDKSGSVSETSGNEIQSEEEVSCDTASDDKNSSQNLSTVSQETDEKGNTADASTTELDKSICATKNVGSENISSPAVKRRRVSKDPLSAKKAEENKQEKLRLRAEKEKQLQESRMQKKRIKEAEKEQREVQRNMVKQQKLREAEEKQAKKQAEAEEKQAKKQAEVDEKLKAKEEAQQMKLDEKKRKDEEKQRKKEEKQKEEEEKLRKLEEKKKADSEVSQKSKAVFANFFIKNTLSPQQTTAPEESHGLFKPFEVTKNMILASITPEDIISQFDKTKLDGCFLKQDTKELFLQELRCGDHIPYKRAKVKKTLKDEEFEDVIIVEEGTTKRSVHRAKLFQFCENVRPPYYGTWTKTSQLVNGKSPFALDLKFFDYEVDSEEEWDEGGPGESLSGTEDEKESEDDYEVDNEFFVPHGYLSADEEKDEDQVMDSEEHHQARLKMREREFQEERKQKFSELKPRVVGCVWVTVETTVKSHHDELCKVLAPFTAVLFTSIPIPTEATPKRKCPSTPDNDENKAETLPKPIRTVPEEAIPFLIRLVHANTNGKHVIEKEFRQFWTEYRRKTNQIVEKEALSSPKKEEDAALVLESQVPQKESLVVDESEVNSPVLFSYNTGFSKRQLALTLTKISSYGRCPDPNFPRFVWWVKEEIRDKYGCTDLPIPNKWCYVSRKNATSKSGKKRGFKQLDLSLSEKALLTETEPALKSSAGDTANSILKFTCKMSPSERAEAALQSAPNTTETKNKEKTSIRKFTRKLTNAERFEVPLPTMSPSSSKSMNSETKAIKESDSVLKFTRVIKPTKVIKPIKVESPVFKKVLPKPTKTGSSSKNASNNISKSPAIIPEVIVLSDSSNI